MSQLKTERGQHLLNAGISLNRCLYHAAMDYFHALKHPLFAAKNGCTVQELHHDMLIYLQQWCDHEGDALSALQLHQGEND